MIDGQLISDDELPFLLQQLKSKRPRTPKNLIEAAMSYFKAAHNTKVLDRSGNAVERPWTLDGLLLHIGLIRQDWREFKARDNFKRVCERIEMLIYTQKFELAAIGVYNSTIMCRDLDLVDKSDVTSNSETMQPATFVRKIVHAGE